MRAFPFRRLITLALLPLFFSRLLALGPLPPDQAAVRSLDVAPVWSAHPVQFALLTHGDRQYVAYYDDARTLTIAARKLSDQAWTTARLPVVTGWDSHNYLALAADRDGQLHLSGNMHVNPLIYFRTTRPGDIATFERIAAMTGIAEERVTYPLFFKDGSGELLFTYRNGGSGRGDQIYNRYDAGKRTWSRLLDTPLTAGGSRANAYLHGPILGPDGWFHLCWVWRLTPDCSTNTNPSYARSRDLVHWENSRGEPLALPITPETSDIIEPIAPRGGIINNNIVLGFDSRGRAVVSYHKFDAQGFTQIYNARSENGAWRIVPASDWNYRWEFSGGGSIDFEIQLEGPRPGAAGQLRQPYWHARQGAGHWRLDETTLKPIATVPAKIENRVEAKTPGMVVNWAEDSGEAPGSPRRFMLRWETLGNNRDRPRAGEPPAPTTLRVIELAAP
ncbi:MAG TPA: BNR repeat-containing protein [Opitutaceae bacterium]|nr:BNR repeat-containing protein [Opitutaceae bacterium]